MGENGRSCGCAGALGQGVATHAEMGANARTYGARYGFVLRGRANVYPNRVAEQQKLTCEHVRADGRVRILREYATYQRAYKFAS